MLRAAFLAAVFVLVPCVARADDGIAGQAWAASGDTLVIGQTIVRLRGVDAAESDQTCARGTVAWPCGADATAELARMIAGRVVTCRDPETLSAQTIAAHCAADGVDLARHMAGAGFAFAEPTADPAYAAAEAAAADAGLGMWSGTFMAPARWKQVAGCSCSARKKAFMRNTQSEVAEPSAPTN
ncbi:MAG: thermonuclease family protein [Alphaproteobacteria bacterium]